MTGPALRHYLVQSFCGWPGICAKRSPAWRMLMFQSWLPDEVLAANVALRSMRDKGARWWSFSVSHTTFDIVIGDPLGDDNVVLCIPACDYLAGPVHWPNQQI